jgi:hypothetical protein
MQMGDDWRAVRLDTVHLTFESQGEGLHESSLAAREKGCSTSKPLTVPPEKTHTRCCKATVTTTVCKSGYLHFLRPRKVKAPVHCCGWGQKDPEITSLDSSPTLELRNLIHT